MLYNFKDSDLTKEKSLWDIYKLSRKIYPGKLQFFIIFFVALMLFINAFLFDTDLSNIISDTRLWAGMGFNFSITTLGFLIAGFTIFSTLSKPRMMLAMMDHINEETGLPTLKYNFFTFMKVFITYIIFSLLYLLVILIGQEGGFVSQLIKMIPDSLCLKVIVVKLAYIVIGASFVHLLLLLKSFIFNIYAIVMNFLRWEYHQED